MFSSVNYLLYTHFVRWNYQLCLLYVRKTDKLYNIVLEIK